MMKLHARIDVREILVKGPIDSTDFFNAPHFFVEVDQVGEYQMIFLLLHIQFNISPLITIRSFPENITLNSATQRPLN